MSGGFEGLTVPQPYVATVDFWLGGTLVTGGNLVDNGLNFTLVSFTHTMETSGTAHSFNITLFDKTWTTLEQMLFSAGNQVHFKYYYVGPGGYRGKSSREFEGTILKWTPTLTQSGVLLSIEGIGGVASKHTEKTKSWSGPLNTEDPNVKQKLQEWYSFKQSQCGIATKMPDKGLRISDIVELICSGYLDPDEGAPQKKFWKTWMIDPKTNKMISTVMLTEDILVGNGLNDTQEWSKFWQQGWMDDWAFLKYLAGYAKSTTGEQGYDLWMIADNPKPILNFRPRSLGDLIDPKRIFNYMYGDPRSEVIRFTPNVEVAYMYGGPGVEVKSVAFDVVRRKIDAITVSDKNRDGKAEADVQSTNLATASGNPGGSPKEPAKDSPDSFSKDATAWYQAKTYSTPVEALNEVYSLWYQNYVFGNTAELLIQGDPDLELFDVIAIYVLLPTGPNLPSLVSAGGDAVGTVHPTSGPYRISRIIHTINPGTWTTTYELYRAGILVPPGAETGDNKTFKMAEIGGSSSMATMTLGRQEAREIRAPGAAEGAAGGVSRRGQAKPFVATDKSIFNLLGSLVTKFGQELPDGENSNYVDFLPKNEVTVPSPISGTVEAVTKDSITVSNTVNGKKVLYVFSHFTPEVSLKVGSKILQQTSSLGDVNVNEPVRVQVKKGTVFQDPQNYLQFQETVDTGV